METIEKYVFQSSNFVIVKLFLQVTWNPQIIQTYSRI